MDGDDDVKQWRRWRGAEAAVGGGGGVLPSVEVHEAEIVRDDPLEWVEVERALEARDGGDVPLLTEEAHANIVPQLRRVGRLHRGDAVLD